MFSFIKKILPTRRQRTWFWIVLLLILSFYPYEIANAFYPIDTADIRFCFALCLVLTPISIVVSRKRLPQAFIVCLIVMLIGSILSFYVTQDKYYYHKLIRLYSGFCLIIIVYNVIGYRQFFTLYNRWILIMAILGCIGFVLSLAGVPPFTIFIGKEDGREVYSWIITFTKTPPIGFIRYAGFFDEPGAMGYWGCFALGINRILIKDEKIEKLLLIALIFTFSMGYIMQAIAYVVMFSLFGSRVKDRFAFISIALALIIGLYSLRDTSYSVLYDESIGRIEQMFNAGEDLMAFEGTSREVLVENSKAAFKTNPVWGIGWPNDGSDVMTGDNYYETLAHDGIVGMFYQYFPYILLLVWAYRRNDWEMIFVIIFLALAIFHRPIHPNMLTYFIYYSLPVIYYIKVIEIDSSKRREYYV